MACGSITSCLHHCRASQAAGDIASVAASGETLRQLQQEMHSFARYTEAKTKEGTERQLVSRITCLNMFRSHTHILYILYILYIDNVHFFTYLHYIKICYVIIIFKYIICIYIYIYRYILHLSCNYSTWLCGIHTGLWFVYILGTYITILFHSLTHSSRRADRLPSVQPNLGWSSPLTRFLSGRSDQQIWCGYQIVYQM